MISPPWFWRVMTLFPVFKIRVQTSLKRKFEPFMLLKRWVLFFRRFDRFIILWAVKSKRLLLLDRRLRFLKPRLVMNLLLVQILVFVVVQPIPRATLLKFRRLFFMTRNPRRRRVTVLLLLMKAVLPLTVHLRRRRVIKFRRNGMVLKNFIFLPFIKTCIMVSTEPGGPILKSQGLTVG